MADGAQQSAATGSAGRQPGEPMSRTYDETTGPVMNLQRPGGIAGSTTGADTDTGREGVVTLGVDLQAPGLAHTGL